MEKMLNAADAAMKCAEDIRAMRGSRVELYDVHECAPFTDFYVMATARSQTHLSSLADAAIAAMEECGYKVENVEGRNGDSWILVDFSYVIVHLFTKESREYYNLERLLPLACKRELPPAPED